MPDDMPHVPLFGWPVEHPAYTGLVGDPLPQRWVDLIHELDERERLEKGLPQAPSAAGSDRRVLSGARRRFP